jgi:hypothetical protein
MPVPSYQRRQFISNGITIAILSTIIPSACRNHTKTTQNGHKEPVVSKKGRGPKRNRKKWSYEGVVINSKTKLMHLPSSHIYHYYDPIKQNHFQAVAISGAASLLQGDVRLPKGQSGNILEVLSLQPLRGGINDGTLSQAADILSMAFMQTYDNAKAVNVNTTNFRLHELMLQLVSLNNSVVDKWQTFNEKVKKPATLRKRQAWMETSTAFRERVEYILARQGDYHARLMTRAQKYNYT